MTKETGSEPTGGLAVSVTSKVPLMEVQVNDGCVIGHNDRTYYGKGYTFAPEDQEEGDTLVLDGPTAISLMQSGQITIKRTVEEEA